MFNSKEEITSHQVDTLHTGMCMTKVHVGFINKVADSEDKGTEDETKPSTEVENSEKDSSLTEPR